MRRLITIRADECTGCRMCELACSFVKESRIVPELARIRVFSDWTEGLSVPIVCSQCARAPCMSACPTKALRRNGMTEAVLLDRDRCIGCRSCVSACPFGAVAFSEKLKNPVKCDLCGGDPTCVNYCPTGAIQYEEPSALPSSRKREIADATVKGLVAKGP